MLLTQELRQWFVKTKVEKNADCYFNPFVCSRWNDLWYGEETMAFYPLLIPVMIAVGFDSIVAVAIILIGSQIGCLASTINPFATGVAADAAGVSIADGMIWRVIQWVILVGMSIWFVYNYASKIEEDPSKSLVADKEEEHKELFQLQNSEKT